MTTYEAPIFICGLPRSGSTLLELTVSRSPGVLRLAEPLYLSPWRRDFRYFLRQVGDLSRDGNLRRMVELVFSDHGGVAGLTGSFWRFRKIKALGENELQDRLFDALVDSDRSLSTIFRVLLKELSLFNDCRRCCVPFPVHIHHVPQLMQWMPDAKVVHLTRDPRAIAISKTNDPGGTAGYNRRWPRLRSVIRKAMMAFVVVQYIQASRTHEKLKNHSNYLLVQYEDLVMRPLDTMQRVCSFADIEITGDMLEQAADRAQRSSITGELRTKPDATAAGKWKHVIGPFERAAITALTRRAMQKFGFDYESHPVYSVKEEVPVQ